MWLSSRPNKRAIGLARERTHAVNTILHAWVTPASVRALGATKSTHSATDTWTTLADAPEPHNHVFVENGEYFSAFGHVANEGPVSYHVPTDTWVEGAPGFPVLQQGHANGCGFALAMLP